MYDDYPMINGRGYPDTINTDPAAIVNQEGFKAQPVHSLIEANSGQRILLRISNVSTTHLYTVATTLGVPMKVVGRGAALLRGPTGLDTSYEVSVLNVGGGQAYDVIVDTAGVASGTYFLYTTSLANLANGNEERGGIMTEIVIN
jgi:FtsP/CotA-like multicopper oxidase with cupredoxin domain